MKRYFILTLLFLASAWMVVAHEEPDTLLSVENTQKVIIVESPGGVEVKVVGSDVDSTKVSVVSVEYASDQAWTSMGSGGGSISSMFGRRPRKREHLKHYHPVSVDIYGGGLMFGFVDAFHSPAGLDVEMGKSFELGIYQLVGMKTTLLNSWADLTVGMGLDWRNYKLTTSTTRFIPLDGQVTFGSYPEGVQAYFSRLKVFSLTFPIMWEQRFPFKVPGGDYFSISFGITLNYNGHASLKSRWMDSSFNNVEEYCGNIGRRPFSFDYVGIVRLSNWLGVYAKYSPKTVLRGNINPSFKSFSSGLILFY